MSEFVYHMAGATEAQQKQALSYLLAQDSAGLAKDGVLSGLAVSQQTSASKNVDVALGAAVVQDSGTNGAAWMVNNAVKAVDVLVTDVAESNPRNDLIVFDSATKTVRKIKGTASATPADPTVPATAVKLARVRVKSAATYAGTEVVAAADIDDLRPFTRLFTGTTPYADYYRGASGTFAGGAATKLAFPTKNEAYGITYSSGDFTVSEAGRYDCRFEVMFANATGMTTVGAQIWVNGAFKAFVWETANIAGNWSAFVSRTLRLAANDVVSFYAYHNATAAQSTVSDPGATWCQIQWIAP